MYVWRAQSESTVNTRRAPSRHSRDAKVYGHTTTAMRKIEYPPPPHQIPLSLFLCVLPIASIILALFLYIFLSPGVTTVD